MNKGLRLLLVFLSLASTTSAIADTDTGLTIERLTWAGIKMVAGDTTVFIDAVGTDIWDGEAPDGLVAVAEVLFPTEENRHSLRKRLAAAYASYFGEDEEYDAEDFDVHRRHTIETARGATDTGETDDLDEAVVPSAAE